MPISYNNQPSMAQRHENEGTFSQSNPECNNLSQNSIDIQGAHQSICIDGPDVDVPFHSPDSHKIHRSRHYVKWGIAWQPLWFMISLVLCGYVLAIGHHLYISSLHKTAAGSPLRQQWAISRDRSSLRSALMDVAQTGFFLTQWAYDLLA
ncbi:hypothetical protein BHYA_0204g00020 [Botrytis hyacinthi]|uniref:Uncharacterized protein n=1 Tax=Botrytis hyacinthi TaxID=278943 RepID=A0A4Z1GBF2_9HELO|nr:hypothetical protein BHYA_0204g00020 [Botrytis hyacinthi]